MKDWHTELRLPAREAEAAAAFDAALLESNAPGNIFWPGERPKLTFQIRNRGTQHLAALGHVEVIEWATEGIPGDIWLPQVRNRGALQRIPIAVELPPLKDGTPGWTSITVEFTLPERMLGWMAIVDLGDRGRRMLTHGVRTFSADPRRIRHPSQSM